MFKFRVFYNYLQFKILYVIKLYIYELLIL